MRCARYNTRYGAVFAHRASCWHQPSPAPALAPVRQRTAPVALGECWPTQRGEEWPGVPHSAPKTDAAQSFGRGPLPPPEWALALRQLTELTRGPVSSPSWWRAAAFDASLETLTDPGRHATCDQPGQERDLPPAIAMQLGLAGWGHFRLGDEEPQQIGPGRSFFFETSGLSHYLPAGSPGWTFVRLAIYHPYLKARLAGQVSVNGPLFDLHPDEALTASLLRLVRGAIKKDFQDQFEAEMALFTFVLGFERRSQQTTSETRSAQRMMGRRAGPRSRAPAGRAQRARPGRRIWHEPQPLQSPLPCPDRAHARALRRRGPPAKGRGPAHRHPRPPQGHRGRLWLRQRQSPVQGFPSRSPAKPNILSAHARLASWPVGAPLPWFPYPRGRGAARASRRRAGELRPTALFRG